MAANREGGVSGLGSTGSGLGKTTRGDRIENPALVTLRQEKQTRAAVAPIVPSEWEYTESPTKEDNAQVGADRSWLFRSLRTFTRSPASALMVTPPINSLVRGSGKPIQIQVDDSNGTSLPWKMWVLNNAGESPGNGAAGNIAGPVPRNTFRPRTNAASSGQQVPKSLVLSAVIRHTGRMEDLKIIRGLDANIDQKVLAALTQWNFQPANRGGVPIDVDVIISIPF
jgi:hypothetical protein